ncbi:MAG: 2-C-methyl-D-erythritol 4-phosphate cytidylyltransferase [Candidatus Zixiibacteriota bacterium]
MVYAIIVSAGKSERFGGDVPKQFVEVCGKPILAWTLERFEHAQTIDKIVIVASADHAAMISQSVVDRFGLTKVEKIVEGGASRAESVLRGLESLPSYTEIVAIHDGVRPMVHPQDIDTVVNSARHWGGAILASRVTDTIKLVSGEKITSTLDRASLFAASTPQAFQFGLIRDAHRHAHSAGKHHEATDDAVLVERMGHAVHVVVTAYPNPKITHSADIAMLEFLLSGELHG